MIRVFGSDKEHFLLNIERIQDRAAKAQRQITSGYRVGKPSDAPHQIVDIVQLQLEIAQADQRLVNLQRAESEVKTNESALRNAVKILQDVTVAGTQGADAHADAGERQLLADRVREWHAELVRIANLHHSGRYQFSGDQDGVAPYAIDLAQPGGVVRSHNSPESRLIEDAAGNQYSISRRAQDIFDARDTSDLPAAGNVFRAVHALSTALEANDPDAASLAMAMLSTASKQVNEELSTFGIALNRLDASIDQAHQIKLRATTELASRREANIPEAVMELTQAGTNLEAALAAQARLPRTTLFDYLG
jgi:flagellin-like hook-associated protein FlgL